MFITNFEGKMKKSKRISEEDLELNEKTKKEIEISRKQARQGKVVSHEEVMKRFG